MDHSVFSDQTIKSKTVSSDTHSWNIITIGRKNYFVDVTWYDQTGGTGYYYDMSGTLTSSR